MNTKKLFATTAIALTTLFPLKGSANNASTTTNDNKTTMGIKKDPLNNPEFLRKIIGRIGSFIDYQIEEEDTFDPETFTAKDLANYFRFEGDKYVNGTYHKSKKQKQGFDKMADTIEMFGNNGKETVSDIFQALKDKYAKLTGKNNTYTLKN